jgi:hypothetical protein
MDRAHTAAFLSPGPPPKVTGWYKVSLSDTSVCVYSTLTGPAKPNDGVVVREGHYARFGSVTGAVHQTIEFNRAAAHITAIDRNYALSDYVKGQSDLAQKLVPLLLKQVNCPAILISAESASWQSRGMLRLRVSDPDAPNMTEAVAMAIQIFCVAVEVVGAD